MQDRGVATSAPGLYFLGIPFLSGFTSMLVVGAGRDAGYVVARVAERAAGEGNVLEPAASSAQS